MLRSARMNGRELLLSLRRRGGFIFIMLSLHLFACVGCVTRMERIAPYQRVPQDESVWDELRREFGGHDSTGMVSESSTEPLYKRAARSVKETVSRWFQEDSGPLSEQEIAADRRRFERKRAPALEQLRDQQKESQGEEE